MKKYKLTTETKEYFGRTLFRIEATADFGSIKKGDKGGFVEKEDNLSQEGNAWVYGDARVYGDAEVYGNARVSGNASVYGNARVSGDAEVYGDARVYGNARVYGKYKLTAGLFFGFQYKDETIHKVSQSNDYTLLAKGDVKCEPIEEEVDEDMIEIDGKKWSKSTIKEALKNHAE